MAAGRKPDNDGVLAAGATPLVGVGVTGASIATGDAVGDDALPRVASLRRKCCCSQPVSNADAAGQPM